MPENPKNKEGIKTVDVYKSVYEGISKAANERSVSIKDYVNDTLGMVLEKEAFLKDYASHLSKLSIDGKSLFVKDGSKNIVAEVVLSDNVLYCLLDHSKDCLHIQFALALTDFAKLYVNRSRILPMIIKDEATGKFAKVDYYQSRLYCYLCQSGDCAHADIARIEVETKQAGRKKLESRKNRQLQDS
jgi:hypothetical protein